MCGRQQKISSKGENKSWASTVFCTTESFFGGKVFEEAANITKETAFKKIKGQILLLNPEAQEKKIGRFILG